MAPPSTKSSRKSLYASLVAKDLKTTVDSFPQISEIRIEPHDNSASEHPYKMLVGHIRPGGAKARVRVWAILGPPPTIATNAPRIEYLTLNHDTSRLPFSALEEVDLVEPFCTFWKNTRNKVTRGD
jgi:hypothetical protein